MPASSPDMDLKTHASAPLRTLLIVTAVFEAGMGLALAVSPSVVAWLLFGTTLGSPAAETVGRVAGVALVTWGLTCWLGRNGNQYHAAERLIPGLVLYNAATAALLTYSGLVLGLLGLALWPAILFHLILLSWCLVQGKSRAGLS